MTEAAVADSVDDKDTDVDDIEDVKGLAWMLMLLPLKLEQGKDDGPAEDLESETVSDDPEDGE